MRQPSMTQAQFFGLLQSMGISPTDLQACLRPATFDEKKTALEAFKTRVRKAFRQKQFETHPDRCKEADAEERMKALNAVQPAFMAVLDSLHVAKRPPPQPVRRVILHHVSHGTSTTTGSVTGDPFTYTWYNRAF